MKIGYWISTVLFSIAFFGSAIMNLLQVDDIKAVYVTLGYPPFMMRILGPLKLAGVICILLPMVPRKLKEAAYTGFGCLVFGGVSSHIYVDGVAKGLPLLVLGAIGATSYVLYQKLQDQKLQAAKA